MGEQFVFLPTATTPSMVKNNIYFSFLSVIITVKMTYKCKLINNWSPVNNVTSNKFSVRSKLSPWK